MWKNTTIVVALLCLFIGLWPPSFSLYGFTGEEEPAGQLLGVVQWLYTTVRPAPQLAPWEVQTTASLSPFGVNTFLEQEVLPEVRDQSLQMIHAAGMRTIRQQFSWEDIEIHGKGDFIDRRNDPNGVDAWAKYDNILMLAKNNGIEVIARLDNPPAWSRALTDTIGTHAPPDNFADYGDFVAAVAERYGSQLTYYQLWNEPNIYPEWGERPVDPESFTELLCIGYQRIKEIDPSAIILVGAVAPTVALNYRDMNNLVYLQRMYDAGAADCFDILSAQGYGLWSGATDERLRPTVINYPHHLFLRDVMVANGDQHKQIWISEMAWNTVPDGLPQAYGQVSDEQQARYTQEAYERLQRDWPWVGVGNYWFFKRATDLEKEQPQYYFRLVEPDFTPLPVYQAMQMAAASDAPAERRGWWYLWQQSRRFLVLGSLGWLLFLLLRASSKFSPVQEQN